MTNLNPNICYKIRDARRAAKISQSELAAEIGCKQSAISMFEQGNPTKLNSATVQKIAEKFSISLEESGEEARPAPAVLASFPAETVVKGFCVNPCCPSNRRIMVGERQLILPDRKLADPVGGRFCAMCGEVLEKRCPSCGSPVHDGAVCSFCGEVYVMI